MEGHETVIIGGGQAGLAMSYHLRQRGREHLLIERDRLGGRWHSERWDSLHYQFPNWSLRLPGYAYHGDAPEVYPHYSEVIAFLADYAAEVGPPVRLGVEVTRVSREGDTFRVDTSDGPITAKQVVVATGAFPSPRIPDFACDLCPSILQLHSSAYRSPSQLPTGGVLVVGSGSSGGQIAEELHESGRRVALSVSRHRRVPRRFQGKDILWWLYELGWMDRSIDSLPDQKPAAAILLSGYGGGHDLDVREFGERGMVLLGRAVGADGKRLYLSDDLGDMLDAADAACADFLAAATAHAEQLGMAFEEPATPRESRRPAEWTEVDLGSLGLTSIIWCTGYRPAFEWIDVPVFDASGAPVQKRGQTACAGLYFLGLHWMHTFKSGALFGVGEDAEHLANLICQQ